ncbi:hypothetical protein EYR36_003290 [Pleurotus pulmonarius]|nr:hypothetical protein EYR36_003290 [Pleurotus pulmonarius]
MSNVAVSTRARAPTEINDIDLARPVATLAETISKAMSALYALHVAMGRSCGETSSNFAEFVEYKQVIRNHWAALESFLQHSLGYARDYLALCQSLQHEAQAQYAAAAFAILAHAQQIRSEISRFKPAYAGMVKEFKDKEIAAKFRRGTGKHGNASSFDVSILPFIQASQSALYPEINDSSKIASSALSDSLIAINDISGFWDRHADDLQNLSRSEEGLKGVMRDRGYYQAEIARWKNYHAALHDAIYSITSSSDAMRPFSVNCNKSSAEHYRDRVPTFYLRVRMPGTEILSLTVGVSSLSIYAPIKVINLLVQAITALKDRELLFRVFWFNAAADSDQLRSLGRVGPLLAQQITPVWQRVEVLLREYRSEIGHGKTLDFIDGPSNDKIPGLFRRRRATKFNDTDTVA